MYIFLQLMALPVLRSRSFFDGAQAGLWLYREVEKKNLSCVACLGLASKFFSPDITS